MPIDFGLLQQGGAGGLPDFVSGIQKQQQEEEARRQQAALAMMQIQAQQQASQPSELDYRKDARAAAFDQVKLAREQQAMGLDLNVDSRAERGLVSDIGLTDKRKEEIDNNIKLNWDKFELDKDISYKDYDLRKDMHEFTKDQQRTKLGYEIKWGDNQDDREERKFGFEVKKYQVKEAQAQQFKDTLAKARQQGSEAVTNALIDNGMMSEAKTFTEMNKTLMDMKEAKLSKKEQKQKELMFVTLAPKILKGEELSAKESQMVSDVLYGEEFTNNLVGSGQLPSVAKTAMLHAFNKDFTSIAGDPNVAAKLAAAENGYKLNLPRATEDVQEFNKIVGGTFEQAQTARAQKKLLTEAADLADAFKLAGIGSKNFQGYAGDAADVVAKVGQMAGIEIKSAQDFGRAEEILRGRLLEVQKQMGTIVDKDGNSIINPRTAKLFETVNEFGGDGIRSLRDAQNFDAPINQAKYTQDIRDKNPNITSTELRSELFNRSEKDFEVKKQSSNPKDQTAAYERYLELKAKAGR